MKTLARMLFTVAVAIAGCWQPFEEEIEGLAGERPGTSLVIAGMPA